MRKKFLAGFAGLLLALFAGQFLSTVVDEAEGATTTPIYSCPQHKTCGGSMSPVCHG